MQLAASAAELENGSAPLKPLESQPRRTPLSSKVLWKSSAGAIERTLAHPTPSINPGDVVPAPPAARTLRLLPFVRDLYDPVVEDLLSNQVGEAANKAAEMWARHLRTADPSC